jgi:hypothetical protein
MGWFFQACLEVCLWETSVYRLFMLSFRCHLCCLPSQWNCSFNLYCKEVSFLTQTLVHHQATELIRLRKNKTIIESFHGRLQISKLIMASEDMDILMLMLYFVETLLSIPQKNLLKSWKPVKHTFKSVYRMRRKDGKNTSSSLKFLNKNWKILQLYLIQRIRQLRSLYQQLDFLLSDWEEWFMYLCTRKHTQLNHQLIWISCQWVLIIILYPKYLHSRSLSNCIL